MSTQNSTGEPTVTTSPTVLRTASLSLRLAFLQSLFAQAGYPVPLLRLINFYKPKIVKTSCNFIIKLFYFTSGSLVYLRLAYSCSCSLPVFLAQIVLA